MDCPVCRNVTLVMADRQGIEIDYCPQCRGVWLDRGELDKLIDRSAAMTTPARQEPPGRDPDFGHSSGRQPNSSGNYEGRPHETPPRQGGTYPKKKRHGFLGELFDFD